MLYTDLVATSRRIFETGRTKSKIFRKNQLKALLNLIEENENKFLDVLHNDLGRCKHEAIMGEIEMVRNEIRFALINLETWLKPEEPKKGIVNILDTVQIRRDPLGLVLIICAWNCPVLLLFKPFVGAIAAGNCVVLTLSSKAENTGKLIEELLPRYLDSECYKVVFAGDEEIPELLKEKFDYIFYTGCYEVGKLIRTAANVLLTPVTLGLGGKSPVYVDETVDFEVAARRIIWGKVVNAGQTYIAPDYVLCNKRVENKLIKGFQKALQLFFPQGAKASPDYSRIINAENFDRLIELFGGRVEIGGNFDAHSKYIEPTIFTEIKSTDPIMHKEIFGPLLPIVNIGSLQEAIEFINNREKPLSIYIFSNVRKSVDEIVSKTSSGSICVNDCLMQFACDNTPFGGVGSSGFGACGGRYSFETFSHRKTCLYKDFGIFGEAFGALRYPPYSDRKVRLVQFVLKKRFGVSWGWLKGILIFLLGMAVTATYFKYMKQM